MRLGVISDAHVAPRGKTPTAWHNVIDFARSEELLTRAIAYIREADVEAVVFLGDLVHDGDEASLRRGLDLISAAGLPVWIVPGNHDGGSAWTEVIARADAERTLACLPDGDEIAIREVTQFSYRADDEVWHATLPELPNAPVVLLTHVPVLDCEAALDAANLRFAGGFSWGGAANELADRGQPAVVLHGHLHVRMETVAGPVLQLGFAALIEAPHAVAVVELDATGNDLAVSVAHHSIADYEVAVVPVLSPAVSRWIARDGSWTPVPI